MYVTCHSTPKESGSCCFSLHQRGCLMCLAVAIGPGRVDCQERYVFTVQRNVVETALVAMQVKSAVLYTETSLCHADFDAPVPPKSNRRRKRTRAKLRDEASFSGNNFRLLPLENPCLLCAFTSSSTALLVSASASTLFFTYV